jgi:hypothetical protein
MPSSLFYGFFRLKLQKIQDLSLAAPNDCSTRVTGDSLSRSFSITASGNFIPKWIRNWPLTALRGGFSLGRVSGRFWAFREDHVQRPDIRYEALR